MANTQSNQNDKILDDILFALWKQYKNANNIEEENQKKRSKMQEEFLPNYADAIHRLKELYPSEVREDLEKNINHNLLNKIKSGNQTILDLKTGKINVSEIGKFVTNVSDFLERSNPEKYVKIAKQKILIEQENGTKENLKNTVDFNNPEEKKAYFDDLYKGLSDCKTKQEKISYIQENFGIPLEKMTEKEQTQVISRFEKRQQIIEFRNTLDEETLRKENPNLDNEEIQQLLEDKAAEQYALEHDTNVEMEISDNNEIIEFENITSNLIRLNQELANCTDEVEKIDINEKLLKLEEDKKFLVSRLALSKEEVKKNDENLRQQDYQLFKDIEIEKNSETSDHAYESAEKTNLEKETELEIDTDLADLFTDEEFELGEDLSDLLDAPINDSEQKVETIEITEQLILADKKVFTNPILTGADEKDLKQEDYTMEIKEKDGLWNRIKDGISKIKNFFFEKLGLTQNQQLKGQAYLNSGENNIRQTSSKGNNTENIWDLSLYNTTQEEVLKKTTDTIQNHSNKKQSNRSNTLEVNNPSESIEF